MNTTTTHSSPSVDFTRFHVDGMTRFARQCRFLSAAAGLIGLCFTAFYAVVLLGNDGGFTLSNYLDALCSTGAWLMVSLCLNEFATGADRLMTTFMAVESAKSDMKDPHY